jgi:hypothetical protein
MEDRDDKDFVGVVSVEDDVREFRNDHLAKIEVHRRMTQWVGCGAVGSLSVPSDERSAQSFPLLFVPSGSSLTSTRASGGNRTGSVIGGAEPVP